MTEMVIAVAGKVAEYLVAPIGRQIGYLFCYRSYTDDLRNKVLTLRAARDDEQISVDEAIRGGNEIRPIVQDWLNRVDQIAGEAEKLLNDGNNKSCFSLKSRYQLGREAYKKAKVIVAIQEARNFPEAISYRVPPRNPTFNGCERFESRASTLNKIMDALSDDQTKIIGVWGMGGVGKTTLVKEVAEEAKQQTMFTTQVYVDVYWTREGDKFEQGIRDIQQHIADMLGLKFEEETTFARAGKLMERLKSEKILIILDDLWKEVSLEVIGIPSCNNDCKILLTSRDEYILRKDMDIQDCFPIQHLPSDEAWHLFKMTAGDTVENNPELWPIAMEVARECQGLPIAIVTIAKALKKGSAAQWKNALDKLRSRAPTKIRGVEKKVYTSLKLSYEHLENDEVKSLFLLCGSLSYGDVSMDRLLRYAMGLDLFDRINSMEQASNELVELVTTLKASSLLLDGEDRRHYYGRGASRSLLFMAADDKTVRMHDVVRDVARYIASEHPRYRFVVREDDCSGIDESKFVSLTCKTVCELPERLVCPKLQFFLLQRKGPSLNIPNTFFEGMNQLKVLDLSQMRFSELPSTLQSLANLRTLCLESCYELRDIVVVGELKKLQVLSMAGSSIRQLPQEMAQLTNLRLLDLNNCNNLKAIPRDILSKLSRLECLFMKSSFSQWAAKEVGDGESNACLSELNRLLHLKMVEIEIPNVKLVPKEDEFFQNLTSFAITIGYFSQLGETHQGSKTLRLHGGDGSLLLRNGMGKLLEKIEALELRGLEGIACNNEQNDSSFKYLSIYDCGMDDKGKENVSISIENGVLFGENSFQNLKEVVVRDCKVLERVFDHQGLNEDSRILPKIEILKLEKLPKLRYSFCNKDKNDNIGYLLSPSKFKGFHRLKELHIIDCGKPLDEKVSFSPNLEVLVLENFLKLKEIDFGISPKLKILKLNKLPKLRRIICHDDKNGSERCDKGENGSDSCLFSPSTFKKFSNIKELSFYGCGTKERRDGDGGLLFNEKVQVPLLESRASTLNKIMDALRDDKINSIGVVGIGGVGKTTLVKQVARQAEQQHLFTKQVYIDLSSRTTRHSDQLQGEVILDIQEKIAEKLFWRYKEWYKNERERAIEMRQRLKKEKVLIIIDDIWKEIDLEKIGIPYSNSKDDNDEDDVKQCKIVLTCRDEPYMVGLKIFRVERLTSEEAWTLFQKTAGGDSVAEEINPEVKSIAKKVFEECCEGLPLAIVPIAEALKDETVGAWENALGQLRNSVAGGKKAVYSCLEWSFSHYTHLKRDDVKSLLLLCGSLSNKGDVSMYDLLQYAVGLDSFDCIDSLEQARDRLLELVEILRASGWLLEGHVNGHDFDEKRDSSLLFADAGNKFVRMNDLVYDMIRDIASKDPRPFIVKDHAGLEGWSETDESKRCTFISLDCKADSFVVREDIELEADVESEEGSESDDVESEEGSESADVELEDWLEIYESNRCDFISLLCKAIHDQFPQGLVCPELQFLLLQNSYNYNRSLNIPDTFFQDMKKLQVLDLPGMSFTTLWFETSFTKLLSSLDSLANLRTLRLNDCRILDGISGIGMLKKLQILSLAGSTILQLPDEITQLSNLRLLDLNKCRILEVIRPNILSSLSRLECLHMRESFSEWASVEGDQSNANACLSELNLLSSLTTLSIQIPDAQMLPKDIRFENLIRYAILIGGDSNHLWGCKTNGTLKLMKVNRSLKLGDGINKLFERSKELEFTELSGTKYVLYWSDEKSFVELKHLKVSDSPEIEHIVDPMDQQFLERGALTLLESLVLWNLRNLEGVWHGLIPIGSFGNLKTLEVFFCPKLTYLLSVSMARGLGQLENMCIIRCISMERIIAYKRESEDAYNESETNLELFPNLRTLQLQELPQLINFTCELETCSSCFTHKVSFSKLEILKLYDVPKLKDVWNPQHPLGSFSNLRILDVHPNAYSN